MKISLSKEEIVEIALKMPEDFARSFIEKVIDTYECEEHRENYWIDIPHAACNWNAKGSFGDPVKTDKDVDDKKEDFDPLVVKNDKLPLEKMKEAVRFPDKYLVKYPNVFNTKCGYEIEGLDVVSYNRTGIDIVDVWKIELYKRCGAHR